jgi:endonuclease YncB( thermonuclease family)
VRRSRFLVSLAVIVGPALGAADTVVLVDGDTLKYQGETIRLVDNRHARELSQPLRARTSAGPRSQERLRQLVDAGPIAIDRHGKDRYGRTLARVVVAGRDVGDTLLREGKTLRYRPGQADKPARLRQWCGQTLI